MTTLTWHPQKKKRQRKHGFRSRSQSVSGRKTLKRRRQKGRQLLSVVPKKK
ncbi:MAG: 50S ribosomal protein L34 [Candidatus Chisholmbacteria bacterium]|nr:50S ribosomal protein L34 [Candidatus Chisholmbacteria bacterium]